MIPPIMNPPKISVELVSESGNDGVILGFLLGLLSSLLIGIAGYVKRQLSLKQDLTINLQMFYTYYENGKDTNKEQAVQTLAEIIRIYSELTRYWFCRKTIAEKIKRIQTYIVGYDEMSNINEQLMELFQK